MREKKNSSKHTGRYNPEEKSKELIQNINKICELRGVSHYTLAKKADISTSTLYSLLTGKSRPYLYTVYKLCNALDISITDLLLDSESEEIKNITKEEQNLLSLYRKCSSSKRHLLQTYLQMLEQFQEE
nr:helix-turn-helix transcriptional regulator [uncultured Blautia sp.]